MASPLLEQPSMNTPARRPWRTVAHLAVLLFCPWWLMATTVSDPARDCFTGISNPTKLRVVLGAPAAPGPAAPSCDGRDGLVPGGSVTLSLTQGPRTEDYPAMCYRYDSTAIEGATGVTLTPNPTVNEDDVLTVAAGTFSSADCAGNWRLVLQPETAPDQLVSPLDAGPTQRWLVQRKITLGLGQPCGGAFRRVSDIQCEDRFLVEGITELTP